MTTLREPVNALPGATEEPLLITAAPHLKGRDSVATIMWNVVAALVPLVVASAWFFGASALLVVLASVTGAVATEHFVVLNREEPAERRHNPQGREVRA